MKKPLLIITLIFTMLLSTAPMVWADTSTTVVQTPSSVTVPNPEQQTIRAELTTLKGLQDQCQALDEQLKSQTQINIGLLTLDKCSISDLLNTINQFRQNNQTLRNQAAPIITQLQSLRSQLASTSDPALKAQLRTAIAAQVALLTPIHDAIKDNLASIQPDINSLKAWRDSRQQAMVPVKTLWTQEEDLWSQVKTLEQTKQGDWAAIKTERASKDYTGIASSLNQIINLKQQIIGLKQQILPIKQQVTTDLQAISNAPAPAGTQS